jgi:uncharacterized Zn-binding protein involved in type VI secretion
MKIMTLGANLAASLVATTALILGGCSDSTTQNDGPPDLSKLVPVTGTVKVNGKPLAGVVVTFLPKEWAASNGETKADGSFSLLTAGKPGAFPGDYKVAMSYLLSTEGVPQGLSARSSVTPSPALLSAKEKVPPEFSDLGRTKLKQTVSATGGTFDFEITADLGPEPTEAKK